MDLHLTLVLLAIAGLCIGLGVAIAHPLATRILAVACAVASGVVLVAQLV